MVELAKMIDLGSIAFGPELERRRIIPEIARLRGALMPELTPPTIEIVYFIPGSLGKADFDGVTPRVTRHSCGAASTGRRSGGPRC